MAGVILRCPNCGTTAAATGECAACHDAAVRYQCTNHAPGRWLESPACPDCGARFGDRSPAPAAPEPAGVTRIEAEPVDWDIRVPPRRTRGPGGVPMGTEPWGRAPGPHDDPRRDAHDDLAEAHRRLADLLAASARGADAGPGRRAERSAGPRPPSAAGCLLRLVVMLVLLFLLMFAAPLLFGLSLLQMLSG